MSNNKFSVGERVNVYGGTDLSTIGQLNGAPGTVLLKTPDSYPGGDDGFVKVRLDNVAPYTLLVVSVHPKQCRRLKAKAPEYFWVTHNPRTDQVGSIHESLFDCNKATSALYPHRIKVKRVKDE